MNRAWVALGSNLDDPVGQVRSGLRTLVSSANWRVALVSRLYRTPPWGISNQPEFINAVAALDTRLTAHELLDGLQDIELAHGRRRDGPRWGPRTLDLDLLLLGECVLETDRLNLPHPHMSERAFVLLPLLELAPELVIPGRGRAAELLKNLDSRGCRLAI